MKLKHKILIRRLIAVGALVCASVILSLLKRSQAVSEYFFARGISRWYVFLVGNISDVFHFSVFELFVYCALVALVAVLVGCIVLLDKKRAARAAKYFLNTLIVALTILVCYIATASACYYRKPIPVPQYQGGPLQREAVAEMMDYYCADFDFVSNAVERDTEGFVCVPYTAEETASLFVSEYERLGTLDGYLNRYTPRVKYVGASEAMCYMGITGITFSVFGEANVNGSCPQLYRLLTAAHELAHAKGVMNEDEANLLAYYLCLTSENVYLRYAAYVYVYDRLINMCWYAMPSEQVTAYARKMPYRARRDVEKEYAFWTEYESIVEKISDFMNDIYLRMSGMKDGVESYVDVEEYVVEVNPSGEETRVLAGYSAVQRMLFALYEAQDGVR